MSNALVAVLIGVVVFIALRMVFAMRGRISSAEAHAKVEAGALLLDVRTPGEFASGGLPGARNIPVQSLAARLDELEKDRPVVAYCASGMRSSRAVALLRKHGLDAYDLGPKGAW